MSTTDQSIELEEVMPNSRTNNVRKTKEAPKEPKKLSFVKKLDPETGKLLRTLTEKANKKDHGRKVRDSEIIHTALLKMLPEDIRVLQDNSMRPEDKVEIALSNYNKSNGAKLTKAEYLEKLLYGEIKPLER